MRPKGRQDRAPCAHATGHHVHMPGPVATVNGQEEQNGGTCGKLDGGSERRRRHSRHCRHSVFVSSPILTAPHPRHLRA